MSESSLREIRSFVEGFRAGDAELAPWFEERPKLVAELHALGGPDAHRWKVEHETSWGPYALNRLVDLTIGTDDWAVLRKALRTTDIAEDGFHPFFHEIVAVREADDPDEQPSLVAEHWPGAFIGTLLLVRAGVTVRAGRNVLDPVTAATSCMYWTWRRRNRPVSDLSHGWGSNSQWRTSFRRDHLVGDELHYNVGATKKPGPPNELPANDLRDLLRFRHSILVDLGEDQWPYDERLVEPR